MLKGMQARPGDIPLSTSRLRPVRRPGVPWIFAFWMAAAAAVALGGGLVLGLLAALQEGIGESKWTQAVQAHGRLQLWGFAGVFIITLAYEFIVRMNGRPAFSAATRVFVPGALIFGSLLQAAGQLIGDGNELLGIAGGSVLVASALWFTAGVVQVRPPHSLRLDPQPWCFWFAGGWLVISAVFSVIGATQWVDGSALPAESHTVAEVFLRGFVLQVILAVAPRAAAGHLGLRRLQAEKQIALLIIVNAGTLAWLIAQDIWILPGIPLLAAIADLSLAAGLLLLTWWLGVFAGPGRWLKPGGERYEWAVRAAWIGSVAYAAGLVLLAVWPGDPGIYRVGAVRHIFMLGFMLPLMLSMAHIVLARFGTGYIPFENVLTTGFVLSVVAWPLRVLPALISESPGEAGQGLMGLAAILTMAALACTMVVCFQVAARVRAPVQRFLQSIPG